MALLDWLQRVGTVGSVARWAYYNYHNIYIGKVISSPNEICMYMFKVRYESYPILSEKQKMKIKTFEKIKIESIFDLCMIIFNIEMDISPNDANLFLRVEKNTTYVLNKLNKKNATNYK